jgi:hypothetical protein
MTKRTVALSPLTDSQSRVTGSRQKAEYFEKLRIARANIPDEFSIDVEGKNVTMHVGSLFSEELIDAIQKVKGGQGDFFVGRAARLWLWWIVGTGGAERTER